MNNELERRIDEKDVWTFKDCLGLASELSTKTRFVVATVLARGKEYVDGGDPVPTRRAAGIHQTTPINGGIGQSRT